MYERICNTMIVLSVAGVLFIGCSIPALAECPEETDTAKLAAPKLEVTFIPPDFSLAFETKANREKAITILEDAQLIFDYIDTVEPVAVIPPKLTYIGNFYITMYAATVDQCGNDLGITASGKKVTEDPECHTVAVDPKIIPLGTKLKIDLPGYENVIFEATDTGGDIKNYWLDVYTDDIPLSYQFNPTYADVWIIEEN